MLRKKIFNLIYQFMKKNKNLVFGASILYNLLKQNAPLISIYICKCFIERCQLRTVPSEKHEALDS